MPNNFLKLTIFLQIIFLISLFNIISFAQTQPTKLNLSNPVQSEIKDGKSEFFSVYLLADQTAQVEVDQTEMDVSMVSFDTSGNELLDWGLPLGRVGNEMILVNAELTGEYRIEVKPGNPHTKSGRFIIKLTGIRNTIDDDRTKNRAAKEISRLMIEAAKSKQLETLAGRRKAVEIWKEIINLSKIKRDKTAEARALHALGDLLFDLGEIQNALDINLQARDGWVEVKNKRFEMIAAGRIGHIWVELGEYEKAIIRYKEFGEVSKEIDSKLNIADSLINIGSCYLLLKQPEKAITYFEQALPIYVELKVPIMEASVLNELGRTYIAFGNYEKGIEYLQNGLSLREKLGSRGETLRSFLSLGKSYIEIGDNEKAYEFLTKAHLLAGELGSRKLIVQSFYYLTLIERDRENFEKAVEHLENGLKIIEKTRGELRNKALRTTYFSTVQKFYELYTDLLIERSDKKQNPADAALAFEMSERARSRSLVDLLQEARVNFKQNIDAKLLEKEKDLLDEINAKYQIREELSGRKTGQEQIDKINAEINDLEDELEKASLEIRQANPRYADLAEGKTATAKEIQNLLDDETVLLEYKLGEKRSFLWLAVKDSIEVFVLPPRKEIEEKASAFYNLIVVNKKDEQTKTLQFSKELAEILLSPVRSKIKNKRLAIVADGVLQFTPFSALELDGKTLADENEIIILPSATVLAQLRGNVMLAKPNAKTIAIFADPVFDIKDSRISKNTNSQPQNSQLGEVLRDFNFGETLPRLLSSRQEAQSIFKLVNKNKANINTDFEANIDNIQTANLTDYRILHFATHGLLNTTRPELSGLVFSLYDKNGNSQDGFLSHNDIYNLNLSSDMIVLSACQTALGKDVGGEGLIGLSRGFLYAGSRRIVASLWKVDDAATAEFMKRFYQNHLEKGMSASAALRQAKIEMKQIPRYKSPVYWSAFTLLGDWK